MGTLKPFDAVLIVARLPGAGIADELRPWSVMRIKDAGLESR